MAKRVFEDLMDDSDVKTPKQWMRRLQQLDEFIRNTSNSVHERMQAQAEVRKLNQEARAEAKE